MADNNEPNTIPPVVQRTTEEIEAIVDKRLEARLKKMGYVTSEQVTALLDTQTNTMQSTISSLRSEVLGKIDDLNKTYDEEMKHWRSTVTGMDLLTRQALEQNEKSLLLSAKIEGANGAIADTLDRFSDRLTTIDQGIGLKIDAKFNDLNNAMTKSLAAITDRLTVLEAQEKARQDRKNLIAKTWKTTITVIKHPLFLFALKALGVGTVGGVVLEILKQLGGG